MRGQKNQWRIRELSLPDLDQRTHPLLEKPLDQELSLNPPLMLPNRSILLLGEADQIRGIQPDGPLYHRNFKIENQVLA